MSGALQQGFWWAFILPRGRACIAPFSVIVFDNLKKKAFFLLAIGRAKWPLNIHS
jgi:hypothetical protein